VGYAIINIVIDELSRVDRQPLIYCGERGVAYDDNLWSVNVVFFFCNINACSCCNE